jgi:hypothetical protein
MHGPCVLVKSSNCVGKVQVGIVKVEAWRSTACKARHISLHAYSDAAAMQCTGDMLPCHSTQVLNTTETALQQATLEWLHVTHAFQAQHTIKW